MRKILDILRLHFTGGLSNQAIADSLRISKGSVFNCLQRFEAAGLSWPLPEGISQSTLQAKLYPKKAAAQDPIPLPDFDRILTELKRPHVTRELLFKEYRETFPQGLGRSSFYERLCQHARDKNVTLHQNHIGGDKLFVDYSGDRPSYIDLETGELKPVELFVARKGSVKLQLRRCYPNADLHRFRPVSCSGLPFLRLCARRPGSRQSEVRRAQSVLHRSRSQSLVREDGYAL